MDTQKVIKEALALSSSIKSIEIGEHILDRVPEAFNKFFPSCKAIVVADANTWAAAGEEVYNHLVNASVPVAKFLFSEVGFHADWVYIEQLDELIAKEKGILVAVGSGVINDLAKLSSYRAGQQYMCVATAASVDGYCSSSSSITDQRGAKCSMAASSPVVIVADTAVLGAAPNPYTAAGYADLAAKVSAGAEWMIADLFGTEPIHELGWSLTQDSLKDMISDPDGIRAGDPKAVEKLFVGLSLAGIGMEVAGSSRPASCSDHLYNHYLDMTHHTFNGKSQSHGFQVAVGELVVCALFDAFLEMDMSKIDVDKCVENWPGLESEQQRALDMFKDFPVPTLGYEEITKKWQTAEEVRVELQKVKDTWPELKEKLRNQCYSYEKMKDLFARAGVPTCGEDIGVSNAQLKKMTDFVQLMRWRINLLDLAKRAGVYDELIEKVFGAGGPFECKD